MRLDSNSITKCFNKTRLSSIDMGLDKRGKSFFIIISIILMSSGKSMVMATEDLENLISLFDRPLESLGLGDTSTPTTTPSFKDGAVVFEDQIPPLVGRAYSPGIVDEDALPPLDDIKSLGKREEFSIFIPKHLDIASKLVNIFFDAKDEKQLYSWASRIQGDINPYLFSYAFSVALMHRSDTRGSRIPSHIQSFPYKYLDKEVFLPARAQLASSGERKPIELERTASDSEDEHRLAYWREDIALNLHHWHWHLAYPNTGRKEVIEKDRRGELFYYMHQQVLARYNFERLCNNLKLVERLSNWYSPIKEAYFPKLDNLIAKEIYPSRPKNMIFDDIKIHTQDLEIDVGDMIRYRDRIFKAIDLGYVEGENGEKILLDNITGINTLGNIIESSDLSPNPRYYGNLHGSGHIMIAYIHDPKYHHLQSMGVMGDTATAMRDPVFYRWHAYINDILGQFKDTLTPYTSEELSFPWIYINSVSVKTEGDESENIFHTYWNKTDVDLIHGLDFADKSGKIYVRYSHLNHRDFSYEISVENLSEIPKEGICRIFLAPAIDESRKPWSRFADQKSTFIEMDKFKVTLQPGTNNIIRKSVESTITVPFEETFYDFDNKDRKDRNQHAYNGCGWPHHLLVPKGAEHGFPSELFVIISDYDDDKVANSRNSHSEGYCGVKGGKFPHKRALGFPFDRLPRSGVRTLNEFLTPNMYVQQCQINHKDEFN